ncbi:YggT family protein [Slackia faecicanis]|uniref:YggT family protein n=1 Tax=Slackia faecicanis TaxID=255723 RepID=A0A3N0ADK1_9ACTN|nr:YggT family protein [Slackia faecicanis]RNL18413.1 YggT family protein [Slackia faecicanis]
MLEYLIVSLADVYTMILFVYVLMSWIPQKGGIIADIDTVLGRVCDPFLDLFRRFIPPIGGMVDISPIFALLVLQFAVRLIVGIL